MFKPQSSFLGPSRIWRPVLCMLALAATMIIGDRAEPAGAQAAAGDVVRTHPQAMRILLEDEIIRGADYGRFAWLELSRSGLARLDASGLDYELVSRGTELAINDYRFDPLVALPDFPPGLGTGSPPAFEDMWLVQLAGPVRDDWLSQMDGMGLVRIQYHAQNAFLVWATHDQIESLTGAPFVRWIGRYAPAYRLAPELSGRLGPVPVTLLVYEPVIQKLRQTISSLGGRILVEDPSRGPERYLTLEIEASSLSSLVSQPGVIVASFGKREAQLLDEMSDKIMAGMVNGTQPEPIPPRYEAGFLDVIGYDGDGVVVHINDAGIREQHADLTSARMVAEYGNQQHHHGTHVAGIVLGLGDGNIGDTGAGGSWIYGLGVAPGAKYVDEYFNCAPATCTEHAIVNDANVSNNSWGYGSGSGPNYGVGYTANARTWDELALDADTSQSGPQPLTIVSAAGNGGGPNERIVEPWEAKNVISVAASRNWRNSTGNQGSGNIDDIASWSSRGNCRDGRNCPVVTAPGRFVISARYTTSGCGAQPAPNSGDHSVCSGTSMAAPHVAGAVALITEWWRDVNSEDPSPAMARALVVNGAKDLGSANIPNIDEGWGRVNVWDSIDPGLPTLHWDQTQVFHDTGDSWSEDVEAHDTSQPLKVTLAWSDAPGPGNGGNSAAWVNDLDLEVSKGASVWLGNVFTNGWSVTGGSNDFRNNLENVYLQSPSSGVYNITIEAANIAGDGVLGNSDGTDQDWALVCQNCVLSGGPTSTPLPTETPTPTDTPTPTFTPTRSDTIPTATPGVTSTATPSQTPSNTPTSTSTASSTPTATATPSSTPSSTPSPSPTPTATTIPTATPSPTTTASPTSTATPTPSATATSSPSATATASHTPTPTPSPTSTPTFTPSATSTPTSTPTPTATSTPTPTNTPSATPTNIPPTNVVPRGSPLRPRLRASEPEPRSLPSPGSGLRSRSPEAAWSLAWR